jgi:hypothetical protein
MGDRSVEALVSVTLLPVVSGIVTRIDRLNVLRAAVVAGLGMLGSGLSAGPAHAAPSPPPAAPASATAASGPSAAPAAPGAATVEQLVAEAKQAMDRKDYAEARAKLLEAFTQQRSYDIAVNLGHAELELGMHVPAAEHLQLGLDGWPATGNAAARGRVESWLADAKAAVGTLRVSVSVAGAEVMVDGAVVGLSPLSAPVFVKPGAHRVEAKREGYDAGSRELAVARGSAQDVSFVLQPASGDSTLPVVAGVGFGLGGAGLVAAIVLTVVANNKAADFEDVKTGLLASRLSCPPTSSEPTCQSFHSAGADVQAFSNAALGTWIAAGALSVATVGYVLVAELTRSDDATGSSPRVAVLPLLGPHTAAVRCSILFP